MRIEWAIERTNEVSEVNRGREGPPKEEPERMASSQPRGGRATRPEGSPEDRGAVNLSPNNWRLVNLQPLRLRRRGVRPKPRGYDEGRPGSCERSEQVEAEPRNSRRGWREQCPTVWPSRRGQRGTAGSARGRGPELPGWIEGASEARTREEAHTEGVEGT